MTDPNQYIIDYLDFYCGLSIPKFAVMLDGQWGCGKTWFINEYIKNREKEFLYISLNGKSTIPEIENDIFELLHPILSSKTLKFTGTIVKSAIKLGFKVDLNQDGNSDMEIVLPKINLKDFVKNDTVKTLIFDDLERCLLKPESILGYINHFVEHQGLNVIIIGNNMELPQEPKEKKEEEDTTKYQRIKEKLIGKTLKINPSPEEAVTYFISEISSDKFKEMFCENKAEILNIFEQSKYENLRLIRYALIDFERIFTKIINEKYFDNKEFVTALLRIFLCFSIEVNKSTLFSEQLENLSALLFSEVLNEKENKLEKSLLKKSIEKYTVLDGWYNFILPETIWKKIFFEGDLRKKELESVIDNSRYFATDNSPTWIKLWHHNLTDEQFPIEIANLEQELAKYEYTNIAKILHIFGLLNYFSSKGLYSNFNIKTLEKYVSDLEKKHQLVCDSFNQIQTHNDSFGLGYYAYKDSHFNNFKKYLIDSFNNQEQHVLKTTFQEEFRATNKKILQLFNNLVSLDLGEKYFRYPVLKDINPQNFIDMINSINDSTIKKFLPHTIPKRYNYLNIYPVLKDEFQFWKNVLKLAEQEKDSRKGKLSFLFWENFVETSEEIIKILQPKQKENTHA